MNHRQKHLAAGLLALAALLSMAPIQGAWAQTAPNLGAASDFAVLSVGTSTATPPPSPDATAAVTTTSANITGNVGSAGAVSFGDASIPSVITGDVVLSDVYTQVPPSPPAFSGNLIKPLPPSVVTEFNDAYDALALTKCDHVLGTLDVTQSLSPGVYCFDAAATATGKVLTLKGPSNGIWIFKIGTKGTGALTGTNFSVVLANGASACNVTWWVAEAATMSDSNFVGTILAGAAITIKGGTLDGRALAKAGVTLTSTNIDIGDCGGTRPPHCDKDHRHHKHCGHHENDKPHCDGDHDGHDGHDNDGHDRDGHDRDGHDKDDQDHHFWK